MTSQGTSPRGASNHPRHLLAVLSYQGCRHKSHMRVRQTHPPFTGSHQHRTQQPSAAPVCVAKLDGRRVVSTPTQWPLESVLATSQRCEACNAKVRLCARRPFWRRAPTRRPASWQARGQSWRRALRSHRGGRRLLRRRAALRPAARGRLEPRHSCSGSPPERIDSAARRRARRRSSPSSRRRPSRPSAWTTAERGEHAWSELDWCLYLSASKAEADGEARLTTTRGRGPSGARPSGSRPRPTGLVDAGAQGHDDRLLAQAAADGGGCPHAGDTSSPSD